MEFLGKRIDDVTELSKDKRAGDHQRFVDADTHNQWSEERREKVPCKCRTVIFEKRSGRHYGEYKCKECQQQYELVTKPKNEGERKKTSKFSKKKIAERKGYDEPFCFICQRSESELHEFEVLERDHIVAIDKNGDDEIGNLRLLCTTCHEGLKPFVLMITGVPPEDAY
jgi:5-methylcytosine-specific restriction endonuclease McrA